jgi:hypothetical protein
MRLAYEDLYLGIFEHYEPEGYMEKLLTGKIATESIRLSTLLGYEGFILLEREPSIWTASTSSCDSIAPLTANYFRP